MIFSTYKPAIPLAFAIVLALGGLQACGSSSSGTTEGPVEESSGSTGSGTGETPVSESRGQLVGYSEIFTGDLYSIAARHYKVIYKTLDMDGSLINASGAISIPKFVSPRGIISAQHGTITRYADAPSEGGDALQQGAGAIALGMIAVVPDYLGFGESKQMLHPYHHASTIASASLDMLRASVKLLSELGVEYGPKLFLMGYSEGGYATMALQREIETNHSGEFSVTASLIGAGAYDLYETGMYHFNRPEQKEPVFQAFALLAFNSVYNWNRPSSDFFKEPYASRAAGLFDGDDTTTVINEQLTHDTAELFNETFLADVTGDGEADAKNALKENNIYQWVPKAPIRLYHGENDVTVPYLNAVTALEYFEANGASDVEIVNCDLGEKNHLDCVPGFAVFALEWFALLML